MPDVDLRCPGCRADLAGRRLRSTTVVTEFCPNCADVVRVGDSLQPAEDLARAADDALAVETWLAEECEVLGIRCEPGRPGDADGDAGRMQRWEMTGGPLLAGLPAGLVLEAAYDEGIPGVVAVRATAVEPEYLPDELLGKLPAVFRDHGLQPHGSRRQWSGLRELLGVSALARAAARGVGHPAAAGADEGDAFDPLGGTDEGAETRWGGEQLLAVDRLGEGLLRPVARRLLAALADAQVTRDRHRA